MSVRPSSNSYVAISMRLALEKTTAMAKIDCGTMTHLKSPSVKRYKVLRLYQILRRSSFSSN